MGIIFLEGTLNELPLRCTRMHAHRQMMLCSYMTIEAAALAYRNNYSLYPCNAFNTKTPPVGPLLWLFYISKILDFVDTIVIVLGKKWSQLSFLHVYHHATIFLMYWANVNIG
jgi:elongation of very long chain fatty acids protein 4